MVKEIFTNLKQHGLNPKDWIVEFNSKTTVIKNKTEGIEIKNLGFIHKEDHELRLVADLNLSNKNSNMQMYVGPSFF